MDGNRQIREKEAKTDTLPQLLIALALAFGYVCGCAYSYQHLAPVAVEWWVYALACILLVSAAALQWRFPTGRLWEWIPAAGSVIALIIFGPVSVFYGVWGECNEWIQQWNQLYDGHMPFLYSEQITTEDMQLASGWLILGLTALVWKLIRTGKTGWLSGLAFAGMVVLIGLNRFDVPVGILLAACSIVMWMYQIGGRPGVRQILWLSGMILVLFVGGVIIPQEPITRITQLREEIKQEIYGLRYGTDTLPHGDLYQAHTMTDGNEAALIVQSEYKKSLYLEGYIGAEYDDGCWKPLSASHYSGEYYGMVSWLQAQGFSPAAQYQEYITAGSMQDAENQVQIENVGADRRLVYVPYGAQRLGDIRLRVNADGGYESKRLFGSRSYQYIECGDMLPTELLQTADWVGTPQTEAETAYTQAEAVYRDFVYENYLEIQPQMQSLMNRAFWTDADMDNTGVFAATDRIRTVLSQTISYVEVPEAVPADADPIRWGLLDAKEGNSAMFASIAVQAYRAYGIPARYVEGYLLQEEQISGESTTLTNRDSHAWVEIYMDGMGWMPVEVTPGFYHDMYELSQMIAAPQNMQKTAALEKDEDQAMDLNADPEGRSIEESTDTSVPVGSALGLLALILGSLICCLMIILELRRWYLRYRYKRTWRSSNEKDRIHLLNQQIRGLFQILEIPVELGWNVEQAQAQLMRRIPTLREGECQRVNSLMEQVLYGELPLKTYEQRTILAYIDKLAGAGKYQNWKIRFRLRYGLIRKKQK